MTSNMTTAHKGYAILVACLWLASCGGSTPATPTTPATEPLSPIAAQATPGPPKPKDTEPVRRAPTLAERRLIEGLERASEEVRQLSFRKPVTIEIENDVAITQSLLEELKDEDIEHARTLYTALGLLKRDLDLRKLLGELLAEQVVGYYNPTEHRLVIRDDVIKSLTATRPGELHQEHLLTLIHELVHALQDQRLNLSVTHELERTADADNAFRAVIEGDATLAMVGHLVEQQGLTLSTVTASIQQLGSLVSTDALMAGEKLQQAPTILRVTLLAPYLKGLQLIAAIYASGGWAAVDRAHASPPTTTEQVLHPQKFLRLEPGEPVRIPKFAQLERAGFESLGEDTLGELELSVYFGQLMASGVDEQAAAGWAGDRLRVYEGGGHAAVVWFTTWDSERDALEAEEAARRVSPGKPTDRVERAGRTVLMIRDLPPALHDPIRRAFRSFAKKQGKPRRQRGS